MAKTREVYPTVAELRRWLDREGVPNHWQMRQEYFGFRCFDPTNTASYAVFSLVPEDEEVE